MVEVSGLLDGMKDLLSLVDRLQQLPLLGQVLFCAFSLVFLVFPVVFSKIIVNKTQRIKNLKNVLSSSMILNGNVTNEVKDVMNSYYFKLATGVSAEGLRRDYLIKFHEEFSYCISFEVYPSGLEFPADFAELDYSVPLVHQLIYLV